MKPLGNYSITQLSNHLLGTPGAVTRLVACTNKNYYPLLSWCFSSIALTSSMNVLFYHAKNSAYESLSSTINLLL